MLDIRFIKENKDIVAVALKHKNSSVDLDELLTIYDKRTQLRQNLDELNGKRNQAAKERNIEEGQRLKAEAEELEKNFAEADKAYIGLMLKVPNMPSADTPIGKDENENKVLREWGTKPTFDFKVKDHHEIGADLGVIDTETATEVSGSRFAYLKGDLALMQFALIQHGLSILTNEETLKSIAEKSNLTISTKAFIPVIVPVIVKSSVQNRMARLLPPENHYLFPEDGTMLVGSAEHTLGPIHMDEVLEEKELPIRYVGYSTAFRREAGTYGKDMKGILRQHQFDKLEMESFSLPEVSIQEQNFLVAIQEHVLQSLNLPYQVVAVCTGDMGFPDNRQIDIETWMPGQDKYRETHSADLTASFQSRRLNTRVKREDGKLESVHMNDATVMAIGRIMIAIIENYQEADGRVRIPEALKVYMNGKTHIEKISTLL
ncbi:MAG: serine--tRNA ligase [Patescibacteria group bacterium]